MRIFRVSGRRLKSVLLATAVASSFTACGKKEEATVDTVATTTEVTPEPTVEGEARPRREPEPSADLPAKAVSADTLSAPALARVPADAPLVLVLRPQAVLEAFGYAGLVEKYAPMASEVVGPVADLLGADPTSPDGWAKLGLDLSAPAGMWVTDLRPSGVVTFVALKDRKAFEAAMTNLAKKAEVELTTEPLGAMSLMTQGGSDRLALLVSDDTVYFVSLYRGTGAADIARGVASRTPEQSLAGKAGFAELATRVKSPDGGLVFRFGEIIAKLADQPDYFKGARAGLESQLEEAKKANESERIAELTRELADAIALEERYAKRQEAESALLKHVFSGLSEVVAGLDAGPDGLDVEARLPMADGAAIATFFKRDDKTQSVLKLAASQPLFSMGGTVDVKAGVALLGMMAAADGEDFDEIRKAMKDELGFDLDTEVFARLDGRLGFVLTGDIMKALKSPEPSRELGGTFVAGLSDAEGIKTLLAKLGETPALAEVMSWDKETGTLKVKLPEGRDAFVTVAADHLVASTDPEAKARVEGSATFVDVGANPLLKARLTRPGVGGIVTLEQSFIGSWLYAMGGGRSSFVRAPSEGESEEIKKVREELAKLNEEITTLRSAVEEARMRPLLDALGKLGTMAQTLGVGDKDVELSMGVYTRGGTLAEAVGALVDFGMVGARGGPPSPDEEKLRELENKRWELEDKLSRPAVEEIRAPE